MNEDYGVIWNPWHGCKKISEGCRNCYMYYLDEQHGKNGADIYKVKNDFYLPLQRNKSGGYKIPSGSIVRVCMTSDFFLEEADIWRSEVWKIIRERQDLFFYILTKRASRILNNLPSDWGDGYENVMLSVTVENQLEANNRIPILLVVPAKYKGIMIAPILGEINIDNYLKSGQIKQLLIGGENYKGARPCNFSWVVNLADQCRRNGVNCRFIDIGENFVKNDRRYIIKNKKVRIEQAKKSGVSFECRPIDWKIKNLNLDLF